MLFNRVIWQMPDKYIVILSKRNEMRGGDSVFLTGIALLVLSDLTRPILIRNPAVLHTRNPVAVTGGV